MLEYKSEAGEGKTKVCLEAKLLGQDLVVMLTAGRVHVGAVALAVPCRENAEGVTASCSVLTAPGHRDNIPAERAAMALCKVLHSPVSVTAGLHLDGASKEEITAMVENSDQAVQNLIDVLRGQ